MPQKKGCTPWWIEKGSPHPMTKPEARRKDSEAHKGKIPWNKGIPCSTEVKEKISKANTGRIRSAEWRQRQSQRIRGDNNVSKRSEVRKKISIALKKEWNTFICKWCGKGFQCPPHRIKAQFCSKTCVGRYRISLVNANVEISKQRLKALQKKPTKPEARIIEILDNFSITEWKYVGNGEVKLGNLYPDFINVNGKKKLIEVFGRVYHDPAKRYGRELNLADREPYRKAIYASLGFDCLVLWDDEMKKLADKEIADIIRKFTNSRRKPTAQLPFNENGV